MVKRKQRTRGKQPAKGRKGNRSIFSEKEGGLPRELVKKEDKGQLSYKTSRFDVLIARLFPFFRTDNNFRY